MRGLYAHRDVNGLADWYCDVLPSIARLATHSQTLDLAKTAGGPANLVAAPQQLAPGVAGFLNTVCEFDTLACYHGVGNTRSPAWMRP